MSRASHAAGFTLLELIVVMAIVAILVAVGFPSFNRTIQSTRLATRNNELLASLGLARSEAIKNNLGAGICPTSDSGVTCGTDWNAGWMVWGERGIDDDTPQAIEVMRVVGGQPNLVFTSLNGINLINFTPRGLAQADSIAVGTTANYSMQPTDCSAGAPFRRNLAITNTGQLRSAKGNCS